MFLKVRHRWPALPMLALAAASTVANVVASAQVPAAASHADFEKIDLRDAPLREALTLIATASDQNLVASNEAAKVNVTIHLTHVSATQAVRAICQTNGLYFNQRRASDEDSGDAAGIVTTVKEFQQGLTVFHEEKTKVYTLLYPNAWDLAAAIRNLFGSRVQLSRGKEDIYDESQDIQRRLDRFDLINSRSQGLGASSLNSTGGTGGSSSGTLGGSNTGGSNSGSNNRSNGAGGGSGNVGAGTLLTPRYDAAQDAASQRNSTVTGDLTADQLARIAALVNPQRAGSIDAEGLAGTGLRANNTPIYVTVLNRNNQIVVRTSDPSVLDEITDLKSKIDIPTPQVLLEVKVLSVELSDGFTSVFDVQFGDQHNTGGFSTGNILPPAPGAPPIPLTPGGSGASSGPFGLNTTSLIYQYVNDNFRYRMQMLDTRNKVTTLATPLLLVANNEVSSVFIGQQYPIVQSVNSQTTAVQGVVQTSPNTNFNLVPVGTTLLITPNINADRTVTLRLLQENSSVIVGGASVPIASSNGTIVNQPLDVVSAQSLSGTVIAKDGLSLALGGLISESVTDTREEIPVLGELPYVGILFRRQNTGRTRNEVIVVIRPFILSTPAEAEAVGKRLSDANSIHPKASELNPPPGEPIGSMKTFLPNEVLRPNPPRNELEKIFHLHSALPRTF